MQEKEEGRERGREERVHTRLLRKEREDEGKKRWEGEGEEM